MEWLNLHWVSDPSIWIGLFTLIILEIVLGVDNLVFIAILADKLPPAQRDRARVIGLALALAMRLVLLSAMSWLVTLTTPLFSVGPLSVSGRDLILLVGGLFLLFRFLRSRRAATKLGAVRCRHTPPECAEPCACASQSDAPPNP